MAFRCNEGREQFDADDGGLHGGVHDGVYDLRDNGNETSFGRWTGGSMCHFDGVVGVLCIGHSIVSTAVDHKYSKSTFKTE